MALTPAEATARNAEYGGARSPEVGIGPEAYARYRWVAERLPSTAMASLLDVGCGFGWGGDLLASRAAPAKVLAIDNDPTAIEYAASHYRRPGLTFQLVQLTEIASSSFDVVVVLEVLEHVKRPELLLAELSRVLRPRGLLFLSTPNRTFTERFYLNGQSRNPFHIREYTAPEVYRMLQERFHEAECFAQVSPDNYYGYSQSCWVPKWVREAFPLALRRWWMRIRKKGDYSRVSEIRFTEVSPLEFPSTATNQLWRCKGGSA